MLASSLVLLTQIVVWHGYSGAEQVALDRVVADYNRQQTEVAVEAVAVPYSNFADKLQAAIPRGHGPDAFIFVSSMVMRRLRSAISAARRMRACRSSGL